MQPVEADPSPDPAQAEAMCTGLPFFNVRNLPLICVQAYHRLIDRISICNLPLIHSGEYSDYTCIVLPPWSHSIIQHSGHCSQ
jgi:hypothetical protein